MKSETILKNKHGKVSILCAGKDHFLIGVHGDDDLLILCSISYKTKRSALKAVEAIRKIFQ